MKNINENLISDISGCDISAHDNNEEKIIKSIRDWLRTASRRTTIPDSYELIKRYDAFSKKFNKACKDQGINSDEMPFLDFTKNITEWLEMNEKTPESLFAE